MTTQVLEREAAPPETGTEEAPTGAVADSKVGEGTEREAQTGQEPNDAESVAEIGDEEPDPEAAAIEAKAEALAEKKLADREAEKARTQAAELEEKQMKERAKRYENLHVETVQATESVLDALPPLFDALGNPWTWTPALKDSITGPTKSKNLTIWEDTKAALYTPIQNAIQKNISEDRYPDFVKEASGKPPEDYFDIYAEYRAPETKWAKGLSLEDAKKLSSGLKAEINAEITEGVRKRIAKGVKAGEPAGSTSQNSGTAGWRTKSEARVLHINRQLSSEQMKRINADASIPE